MSFTKAELEKVKESLPKGWPKVLAEKFGLKEGSIRNIMNGLAPNDTVVNGAVDLAKEYQASIQKSKDAIASL